jgi:uncharacterized protein YndB with AHSA1/START domain
MEPQGAPIASLQLRRTFKAPREKVFQAWIEPEAIKQWLSHPGMDVPSASVDPRVGGAYSFQVRNQADGAEFEGRGVYKEFKKPEKLVFTWSWSHHPEMPETIVTVNFKDLGGSTEVTLDHDLFITEEAKAMHEKGWERCFDNFEKLLAV